MSDQPPIRFECECGAKIKMPATAAGRKARCKACGVILRIPRPGRSPTEGAAKKPASPSTGSSDDWLAALSEQESDAGDAAPVVVDIPAPQPAKYWEEEPEPEPSRDGNRAREDRDAIRDPTASFWADLASSFTFLFTPGNLAAVLGIVVANALVAVLGWIPFLGCATFFVSIAIGFYILAFYMETIRETAGGEDELPSLAVSSLTEDLVLPGLRFIGTGILAELPALGLMAGMWLTDRDIPWTAVKVLALTGVFFWPVIVMSAAIGGSITTLWPHTVIRTVLAAPLAYLAICGALLVPAAVLVLPSMDFFIVAVESAAPGMMEKLEIVLFVVNTCAWIIAMRIIGLFYRHFKHRFPWRAE